MGFMAERVIFISILWPLFPLLLEAQNGLLRFIIEYHKRATKSYESEMKTEEERGGLSAMTNYYTYKGMLLLPWMIITLPGRERPDRGRIKCIKTV